MDRSEGTILIPADPPASPPQAPDRIPLPPWSMYTVLVGLMTGYVLLPILVGNLLIIADPLMAPDRLLFLKQAMVPVSWVLIFAVLAWRYRTNIASCLGIRMPRPLSYYAWQSMQLILTLSAFWGLLVLWALWMKPQQSNPYEQFNSQELSVLSLFAVFTAPFLEEIVFRGFMQSTFHKVTTPVKAVLATGLIFVMVHGLYYGHPMAILYVAFIGLLLGYWRERTQSIVPGMIGHLFNNALASLLMLSNG